MWETLVLALVCVALLALLYAVSGAWKTHPGVKGFARWAAGQLQPREMSKGWSSSSAAHARRKPSQTADVHHGADVQTAIQVLEDLYQEWDRRSRELEARLETVEAAVARLTSILESSRPLPAHEGEAPSSRVLAKPRRKVVTERSTLGRVPPSSPSGDDASATMPALDEAETDTKAVPAAPNRDPVSREHVYFSILDLLHEGRSPTEIQELLGVSPDQVAEVEQLLKSAGPSSGSVQ